MHFPNVALGPFVVMPDHLHGIIILGSNDFFNGDREGVVSRRANMLPTIPEELWKIKEDHSVGRFSILDSGPIINPPGGRLIEGPLNEYSINPPSGRSIERPLGGLMEYSFSGPSIKRPPGGLMIGPLSSILKRPTE